MSVLDDIKNDLRKMGTPAKAKASAWFFKTGPGQYGEGDVFIGVTVPEQRLVARKYREMSFADLKRLLRSPEHEFRLTALLMLVDRYRRADTAVQKQIFDLYMVNTKWVNNWDLVDASAPYIVGPYLEQRNKAVLFKLAGSHLIWERRIAMVASYFFIKQREFDIALQIAEMLVDDTHDLIQKAVGWMLREIGKESLPTEEAFLKRHAATMPRTMLRYAIEKFPPEARQRYLSMRRTII